MNTKFRIYQKSKPEKVAKYKGKMQLFYNRYHVAHPTEPLRICCPVETWDGKMAVPLAVAGYPENDGDDGVVDNIDPPVVEMEDL